MVAAPTTGVNFNPHGQADPDRRLSRPDDDPHLVANECTECGAIYFDRRNACAHCGKTSFGKKTLGTTGVVRSFAIVHQAGPGVPVPYVSTVVD